MEQKKLWDELSEKKLGKLYLLFGDERFLVSHYAKAIESTAASLQETPLHKDVFEGAVPVSEIIMAALTVPFFGGKRLIVIKDSKLFASGRKADSEAMADFLPGIPDDALLLFVEPEVDRRLRLFKKLAELGFPVDCEVQTPAALAKWLTRTAKEKGKSLSHSTASALIATCGNDMTNLNSEMEKLIHYCGSSKDITPGDIKEICTPTLEARIFGLTKAMGAGQGREAVKQYETMLQLKEPPIVILTMMVRQLRIILLCKCGTEKGLSRGKISSDLKIRDFVVSEALSQGRRFTKERLIASLMDCRDTDVKIKTGLISDEIGVLLLLMRIAG